MAELLEAGELLPATVHGWNQPAYLWHEARRPRAVHARALLAPFDSLICTANAPSGCSVSLTASRSTPARAAHLRLLRPALLLGDELVGRVDLKADRQAGVLRVQSAWLEPGHDAATSLPNSRSSGRHRGVLQLDSVRVATRGDLSAQLRSSVDILGA